MSPPWMPLLIGDYLSDTGHLSTTQHGAYLLLIMHYWRTGSLPSVAKLPLRIWNDIEPTIQAFFHNGWSHKRIDLDLKKSYEKYERRANAGRLGGLEKARKNSSNATVLLGQCSSNLEPRTYKDKKEEIYMGGRSATRPIIDEAFEEFWKAYPKRYGANPKQPAFKKFAAAVKSGADAESLIAAAKRYALECREQQLL